MPIHVAVRKPAKSQPLAPEQVSPAQTPAVLLDRRPLHPIRTLGPVAAMTAQCGGPSEPPGAVMQRVVVQITHPGTTNLNTDIVPRIVITGRPERAFASSMGDHTTAFTVFSLGLESRLSGLPVEAAFTLMKSLSADLAKLPGWGARDWLDGDRKLALKELEGSLESQIEKSAGMTSLTAEAITLLQNIVETYLELRELIPLSVINVARWDKTIAGKGKGENASLMVEYQHNCEKIATSNKNDSKFYIGLNKKIKDIDLIKSMISTFDPYAAAVAASIDNQSDLRQIAPGPTVKLDRGEAIIEQHALNIQSLYPEVYKKLEMNNPKSDAISTLVEMVRSAIEIIMSDDVEIKKERSQNNKLKPSKYRLISTNINFDGSVITDVKIAGRPPSPFSNTMGAHTTAWVVLIDQVTNALKGTSLPKAAQALITLRQKTWSHLYQSLQFFHLDAKQIDRLHNAMEQVKKLEVDHLEKVASSTVFNLKLSNSEGQALLVLQESVGALLFLKNSIPGATLDVADINGKREGVHRKVLKDKYSKKDDLKKSILSMLDIKNLDKYLEYSNENWMYEVYSNDDKELIAEMIEIYNFLQEKDKNPSIEKFPDPDKGKDYSDAANFLIKHHLEIIDEAYPGSLYRALMYGRTGTLYIEELRKISLKYRNADAKAYKDVEVEDD